MKKRLTYEYVRDHLLKLGYRLLSKRYNNNHEKLVLIDSEGYCYYVIYNSITSGKTPPRFQKSNPYTIRNIKLWLKLNNIELELISKIYYGSDKHLLLKTKDGYYCQATWDSLKQKDVTEIFHYKNPYTIKNIRLWITINNIISFELVSNTYEKSSKKLIWKCLKEECGEYFETNWNSIQQGGGCPYCSGNQVCLSNCLATKNQKLASEWHPTLNGDLTPYDVTCGSGKGVWWLCDKNTKHEWEAVIGSRTNVNCGCPYCAGILPSEDYNLLIINPNLCKEWNYVKNTKLPEEYCPNSRDKVWWKCINPKCNNEWKVSIDSRSGTINKAGTGCPECSKSHGEKRISQHFKSLNIIYEPQKEFEGLTGLGGGLLSYDQYLPNHNILVEFQGEQHEKFTPWFHKTIEDFEKQVEHDRRKREYAKDHNIQFLEIWYWDENNIECILDNILLIK